MRKETSTPSVDRLCPGCGLCCNGVLFADVRLQKEDDFRRLSKLGLPLRRKGNRRGFPQPCACFDGKLCRIYADRPAYCRAFECGLLKRVQTGSMDVDAALARIAGAKALAEEVRRLLRRLGDRDEDLALIQRYARVMREPIDLSGPDDVIARRAKLMSAVDDLIQVLQREFLK